MVHKIKDSGMKFFVSEAAMEVRMARVENMRYTRFSELVNTLADTPDDIANRVATDLQQHYGEDVRVRGRVDTKDDSFVFKFTRAPKA